MHISKWGNSLAIRIPKAVVDALDLKEGDDVELRVAEDGAFEIAKPSVDELMARFERFRGMMPAGFRFDREDANAR